MIPYNMTTQDLRLEEGEEVLRADEVLRVKGITGNRYGKLFVTNQRVAFVKSVMKMGLIGKLIYKKTAKPAFTLDRETTKAEKREAKVGRLLLKDDNREEKFSIQDEGLEALLAMFPQ